MGKTITLRVLRVLRGKLISMVGKIYWVGNGKENEGTAF